MLLIIDGKMLLVMVVQLFLFPVADVGVCSSLGGAGLLYNTHIFHRGDIPLRRYQVRCVLPNNCLVLEQMVVLLRIEFRDT